MGEDYCKDVDGSKLYYSPQIMRVRWRDQVKYGVAPDDLDNFINHRLPIHA